MSILRAGDAFVRLFVRLSAKGLNQPVALQELRDYTARPGFNQLRDLVSESVLINGHVAEADIASQETVIEFATLLGIDRALLQAAPGTSGGGGQLLADRQHLIDHGRFNFDEQGQLMPRRGFPGRPSTQAQQLDEYLQHVYVTGADLERMCWIRVEAASDLPTKPSDGSQLVVASVPFLGSATDLRLSEVQAGSQRAYVGELDPGVDWQERIEAVVDALDRTDAHIGLIPELTLTDELLGLWREALSTRPRPADGLLKWVLIGTGPLTTDFEPASAGSAAGQLVSDGFPVNRAVILDRITGETIAMQDKRMAFTLSADQVGRWPSATSLAPGAIDEALTPGQQLVVLESSAGRVAIAICEDLGRMTSDPLMRSISLSHLLVPVYGPPFSNVGHWAVKRASDVAGYVGCDVVTYTSHGVYSTLEGGDPATVLAVSCADEAGSPDSLPQNYPSLHISEITAPHDHLSPSIGSVRWT